MVWYVGSKSSWDETGVRVVLMYVARGGVVTPCLRDTLRGGAGLEAQGAGDPDSPWRGTHAERSGAARDSASA